MTGAAERMAGGRPLIWIMSAVVASLGHLSLAWILLRAPPKPEIATPPAILLDLEPPPKSAPERAPTGGLVLPGNTAEPLKPEPPRIDRPRVDPEPPPVSPKEDLPAVPPAPRQAPKPPPVTAKPVIRPGPAPTAPARGGVTLESWQGLLTDKLERAKRFPIESQALKQETTPKVRFTIDRAGRVRSAGIQISSGFPALDDEAVAIVLRADPLPPPPAEVDGDLIELSVFVRFSLCDRAAPPSSVRCF